MLNVFRHNVSYTQNDIFSNLVSCLTTWDKKNAGARYPASLVNNFFKTWDAAHTPPPPPINRYLALIDLSDDENPQCPEIPSGSKTVTFQPGELNPTNPCPDLRKRAFVELPPKNADSITVQPTGVPGPSKIRSKTTKDDREEKEMKEKKEKERKEKERKEKEREKKMKEQEEKERQKREKELEKEREKAEKERQRQEKERERKEKERERKERERKERERKGREREEQQKAAERAQEHKARAKAQVQEDPEDQSIDYHNEGNGEQLPEQHDYESGNEIVVKSITGGPRHRSSNGRKTPLTPKYVDSDVDMEEPAESEGGSDRDPDFVNDKGKRKARSTLTNAKAPGSPEPVDLGGKGLEVAEDKVLEMLCSICLVYGEDCTYSNRNLNNGKKVRSACDNCFEKKVKCSFACGTDHLPFFTNIESKPPHICRCVPVVGEVMAGQCTDQA